MLDDFINDKMSILFTSTTDDNCESGIHLHAQEHWCNATKTGLIYAGCWPPPFTDDPWVRHPQQVKHSSNTQLYL